MTNNSVFFSIITATLGRPSLFDACASIDRQAYHNWEHIVVADVSKEDFNGSLVPKHPNRLVVHLDEPYPHNDYGNKAKNVAYDYINGDYILYLDDDNYYLGETLDILNREIKKREDVDWGVFPMMYFGKRFFNLPPKLFRTDGGQIFHKPVINNEEIRWPDTNHTCEDGKLVDKLVSMAPYATIDIPDELIKMDQSNSR